MPTIQGLVRVGDTPLEELVLDEQGKIVIDEHGEPFFSTASHRLQARNQQTLAKVLFEGIAEYNVRVPPGPLADVGGGDGLGRAIAPLILFPNPQIGPRSFVAFDMSSVKVDKYRRLAEHQERHYRATVGAKKPLSLFPKCIVADPIRLQHLNPRYTNVYGKYMELPRFALVWSNSMFHWIRDIDDKYKCVDKFYDMLQGGGILALSMASKGTAKDFLKAYHDIMEIDVRPYHRFNHRHGYKRAKLKEDPIGSMEYDAMANLIKDSGFNILASANKREVENYANPEEYAESVRVYGFDIFMEPLAHLPEDKQKAIWERIVKRHREVAESRGWKPNTPYEYEQYNIYIIAQVPVSAGEPKAEGPKVVYGVKGALDAGILQLAYGKKNDISIAVEGNFESLSNLVAGVDIKDIYRGIFDYSPSTLYANETNKKCQIGFALIDGRELIMHLDIPTQKSELAGGKRLKEALDDVLKANVRSRLEEAGVVMKTYWREGIRTFEFRIPIYYNMA